MPCTRSSIAFSTSIGYLLAVDGWGKFDYHNLGIIGLPLTKTPASIAGHPIHPMLVPIAIGLWIFSLVCDLIYAFGADSDTWRTVALYTLAGGIVGALLAAVPGLIDLLSLPHPVKRTALTHMGINLTVVALYALNLWLRLNGAAHTTVLWLSVIAIGLLVISGWLGGKMVYEEGVGVSRAS